MTHDVALRPASTRTRDTLFYDGQCPLCIREIRTLRRLQRGGLALADIHLLSEAQGPNREQLLRTLHLRASDGVWHTGVDATVRAWSHTAWGWLFRPLLWPGVAAVSARVYGYWAQRRYQRRYGRRDGCTVCQGGEE